MTVAVDTPPRLASVMVDPGTAVHVVPFVEVAAVNVRDLAAIV